MKSPIVALIIFFKICFFALGCFAVYQAVCAMVDPTRAAEHNGAFICMFMGVLMVALTASISTKGV